MDMHVVWQNNITKCTSWPCRKRASAGDYYCNCFRICQWTQACRVCGGPDPRCSQPVWLWETVKERLLTLRDVSTIWSQSLSCRGTREFKKCSANVIAYFRLDAWQHVQRNPWIISARTVWIESLMFAKTRPPVLPVGVAKDARSNANHITPWSGRARMEGLRFATTALIPHVMKVIVERVMFSIMNAGSMILV